MHKCLPVRSDAFLRLSDQTTKPHPNPLNNLRQKEKANSIELAFLVAGAGFEPTTFGL